MNPKQKLISLFLEQNYLLSEEILESLSPEETLTIITELSRTKRNIAVITKDVAHSFDTSTAPPSTQHEQEIKAIPSVSVGISVEKQESNIQNPIKIVCCHNEITPKRTPDHFVQYFTHRYKTIERILRARIELQNAASIIRIQEKKDKEPIACIGMVYEKKETKNKNILLTLEDPTGFVTCLVKNSHNELYQQARDITPDEVLGITGRKQGDLVYIDSLLWPDVPVTKELKKSPDEVYAVFMSDMEFGSKMFLEDAFNRFLLWINGELGSEAQREATKKIKYLFIVGDLVNGVGIYPTQEKDLAITDVYKQYEVMARHLRQIPSTITIVACPGNHDATRISEPQPILAKEYVSPLLELSNIHLVSNPSWINIHASPAFPGFDVLMYHGFSFIYYANNIESIRTAGGQERADLIMKYLLKRRHMAPTHGSNQYIPEAKADPLVIDKVPDFFISGHLHQVAVAQYKNITLMNCSAWISKTDFQEKMGIEPKPGRLILVNLQTRETKIITFCKEGQ